MAKFYQNDGYNFQDFDLLVENGVIYACYIKKIPPLVEKKEPRGPNRYAIARSGDGVTWEEVGDAIIPAHNSWEETIWAGSISKRNGKYVIYYTGTTTKGRNDFCKIGKAYSTDLINWKKDLKNPVFVFDSENPYYSDEPRLAFRDPFPFDYEGKHYVLFCAKDKSKSAKKQGCVGIVEETSSGQFKWLPPIFSPGIYFDGLECPALYKLGSHWYLLYGVDTENNEKAFRYAIADSPFGPFRTFSDNQLLSTNNYNCRIVNFDKILLLYHWFRDYKDGVIRSRLAPPKVLHIVDEGRLALSDFE